MRSKQVRLCFIDQGGRSPLRASKLAYGGDLRRLATWLRRRTASSPPHSTELNQFTGEERNRPLLKNSTLPDNPAAGGPDTQWTRLVSYRDGCMAEAAGCAETDGGRVLGGVQKDFDIEVPASVRSICHRRCPKGRGGQPETIQ
jgi:hypothetical protein